MKTHVLFIQGGGKGAHKEDTRLVASLRSNLGDAYEVHFPIMPGEADPSFQSWHEKIGSELSSLSGNVVLVSHSIGGSILLRYLSEGKTKTPIAGAFFLAVPAWDGDHWNFDDLKLESNVADRLASIPRLSFYHCRDDATVPFAHLAIHGDRLPQAVLHPIERGGHQFANDLAAVAEDIRGSNSAA